MRSWKKTLESGKIVPLLLLLLLVGSCENVGKNSIPSIESIVVYPAEPKAGQIVTFTALTDDADGDALIYRWIVSGGELLDSIGSNPIQWQAPVDTGTIQLFLTVRDAETSVQKDASFRVEEGFGLVTGHVTDHTTGYLLSDVSVNINGTSQITGPDGFFSFTEIPTGANVPFSAASSNYVTHGELISVAVGENVIDVELILLTEVGRIAGYVTDMATGLKVEGVEVRTGAIMDTTEADGYFELYNVPISQNVPVRATHAEYAVFSDLVNVMAGYNTMDIALDPSSASISGSITANSTGALLAGVVVTVNDVADTTSAAGYYEIRGIPLDGVATFSAVMAGFRTSTFVIDLEAGPNNRNITLVENEGTLNGWVRSSLDGVPISGVNILIGSTTVTSQFDGSFSVGGLSLGDMAVSVSDYTGYADYTDIYNIAGGLNSLTIYLNPTLGDLEGFVVDSLTQAPFEGVTVSFAGDTTITDSDGAYAFSNLPIGQDRLSVTTEGYRPYNALVTLGVGSNTWNVRLVPNSGVLSGTILDELTGLALEGVVVSLSSFADITDAAGGFVITGIPVGIYQLIISATGYAVHTVTIELGAGTTIYSTGLTPNLGRFTGRVLDADTGGFLDSATVLVDTLSFTTSTDGLFEFDDLPVGAIMEVITSRPGYVSDTRYVDVEPGTVAFTIELNTEP